MPYQSQLCNWTLCRFGGLLWCLGSQRSRPLTLDLLWKPSTELLLPLRMKHDGCPISYMIFIILILLLPCYFVQTSLLLLFHERTKHIEKLIVVWFVRNCRNVWFNYFQSLRSMLIYSWKALYVSAFSTFSFQDEPLQICMVQLARGNRINHQLMSGRILFFLASC